MARTLPTVEVIVEGESVAKALVDTGCMKSIVSSRLVDSCKGEVYVIAFDGSRVKCRGYQKLRLKICGIEMKIDVVVADNILSEVEIVLGMDIINYMGGVTVANGKVEFWDVCCIAKVMDYKKELKDEFKIEKINVFENIESGTIDEIISDTDF